MTCETEFERCAYAYSDGSVFPEAYQDSDTGPLVGDTVLGAFDPNAAARGEDPQLEAAVAALMQTIGADADCR